MNILSSHESPASASPSSPQAKSYALTAVVSDIESGLSLQGWDVPPCLYALVPTSQLLEEPNISQEITDQLRAEWDGTDEHLSAIAQEPFPEDDLEEILAHLAWPTSVMGAALSVERIVVPPEVEEQAPEDPQTALEFITSHPSRTDVRIVVGALKDGSTWSAIRTRSFNSDSNVVTGSELVPSLNNALLTSLSENSVEE